MKRVLLITYYYPPRPGIGSLRPCGLAKYLPEFGWEAVVLTPRLPVVVSDVASNLRCVKDGWNGFVEPRGSSEAITASILRLTRGDALCGKFGDRSTRLVDESADQMNNMREMERLYRGLASSRSGA